MLRMLFALVFLVSPFAWASINIENATIRILPPGVPNTAAYFSITNMSENTVTLTGGKTGLADTVEIHNHVMKGEVMHMIKLDKVTIDSKETVHFAPGGLHLMIFNLNRPLQENEEVAIQLETAKGEWIELTAKAQKPQSHAHHH